MQEENNKIKQDIIREFSSGSLTHVVTQEIQQARRPLKQVQGLSHRNTTGFTLLELLVVVLIVGILASIALSQYQKAVKKTRYTIMMTWVKKIGEAQTRYYMENGEYTTSLADLGFSIDPSTPKCGGWLAGGPLWKIDDMCIGVVNQPSAGVVWGSLRPKYGYDATDWNGYAYLQKAYGRAPAHQVICMESRNPGREDPHCAGSKVGADAYGQFYTME